MRFIRRPRSWLAEAISSSRPLFFNLILDILFSSLSKAAATAAKGESTRPLSSTTVSPSFFRRILDMRFMSDHRSSWSFFNLREDHIAVISSIIISSLKFLPHFRHPFIAVLLQPELGHWGALIKVCCLERTQRQRKVGKGLKKRRK
jgi:hypothetical protein